LWLGVEDMTGALVNKGQSADKTLEAFRLLRENGIFPVPMLMHHDSQPLWTRSGNAGLLNQVRLLRKAGALYMQVMMLTPSPGSKSYDDAYTSGLAYESVNGVAVEPRIVDGNYVVASRHPRPWAKQLNLLAAYLYFFNPLRLPAALLFPKSKIPLADAETTPNAKHRPLRRRLLRRVSRKARAHLADAFMQMFGMWGLVYTSRGPLGWCWHLMRGKIRRYSRAPTSRIPMRSPDGGPAGHALPAAPISIATAPGDPPADRKKAA